MVNEDVFLSSSRFYMVHQSSNIQDVFSPIPITTDCIRPCAWENRLAVALGYGKINPWERVKNYSIVAKSKMGSWMGFFLFQVFVVNSLRKKIPHTGDTDSLDQCGSYDVKKTSPKKLHPMAQNDKQTNRRTWRLYD